MATNCNCPPLKGCKTQPYTLGTIKLPEVKITTTRNNFKNFIDRIDERVDKFTIYLGFEKVTDERTLNFLFSYLFRLLAILFYFDLFVVTIDLLFGILFGWNCHSSFSYLSVVALFFHLLFLGTSLVYFNMRNISEQYRIKRD